MYESTSVARRPQMWVFLSARHSDAPDLLPGLVEVTVNGVDTGVMWCYGIARVDWQVM